MITRTTAVSLISLVVASLASAGSLGLTPRMPSSGFMPPKPNPAIEALRGYTGKIQTNMGDMTIAFSPDGAPNTVSRFIQLAQQGAFDGHRISAVFPGHMIVAGGPAAADAKGKTLDFEKSYLSHDAGTLALDRLPAPDPGGERPSSLAAFFINVADQHHLDGDYTVFGRITSGLAVARRVAQARAVGTDGRPVPVEDIVIERIVVTPEPEEETATKPGD